jgi:CHAT domain-containing protein
LEGVDWAVLSACDTGVGEIRVGEGVFGLRRAFQVAGAKTVIMSLWPVEDETTRQWMGTLYREHFLNGKDTGESVRAASLQILRQRRTKHQSTHPFYWGAFIAAGDWH